jgi:hypothetical protein
MSKLLKEAIADAKAVKETALANAAIALQEAFTPRVKSIFAHKIREEADELGTGYEEVGEEDYPHQSDEFGDEFSELSEEETQPEDLDSSEIGNGDNAKPSDHASDTTDTDGDIKAESRRRRFEAEDSEEADDDEVDDEDEEEDDDDEDLDLESIIAELEAELDSDDDEDEDEDDKEDLDEVESDEEESKEDDEEEDDDDEELDLDEILKALREMDGDDDDDDEDEEEDKEDDKEEVDELRKEIASLRNDLTEHRDVILFMKDKLQEVNLLNAKLLYANKLFRSYSLTNEQKVRVIETLDRTATSREVKLVYATLAESLRFSKDTNSRKGNITEGLASKSVKSTKSTSSVEREVILEEARAARFKQLANIRG